MAQETKKVLLKITILGDAWQVFFFFSQKKKHILHCLFYVFLLFVDESVGKTALFQKYVNKKVTRQYKPTQGAEFLDKEISIGNMSVTLQ
ncbi:ras-related protein Rab-7, partial [Reticulomyxa filosa]